MSKRPEVSYQDMLDRAQSDAQFINKLFIMIDNQNKEIERLKGFVDYRDKCIEKHMDTCGEIKRLSD